MVDSILSSLGGGSGIDTKALVDSLVAAERAPRETIIESKTTTLKTQISGYGALRSAMEGVQTSMELLADSDTFNARNVAFADTTLVTPTEVDAGAATGDYSINVTGLAAAHSLSSGGFSDADAVVGNGTLVFSFGDWDAGHTAFDLNGDKATTTLTIDDSNNTLSGIRDAINDGDFGAQATIIEIDGNYTLQITSESGEDNELRIAATEGTPAGLSALSFDTGSTTMAEGVKGSDAAFTINGLAVTRESNQIDDVVEGLNFTLNGISEDANDNMTISVEADKSYGEQIVRDFVEAYNLFLGQVSDLTTPADVDEDAEDQTLGALARDPSTKTMVNQVRSMISQNITGLDGDYTALATIGIQTQISGDLEINESMFSSALENNYTAFTNIFTGTTSSSDARVDIVKTTAATQPGTYEVVVTTDPAKGYAQGGAISVDDATALGLTTATGVFAGGLDTSAGDYSFKISVDGTESNLITLSGDYADVDALITDMQAQINGDSAIAGVGAAVDLSYDSAAGSFSTTSRIYGAASTVAFSDISSDMDRFSFGGEASSASFNAGVITEPLVDSSGSLTAGTVVNSGVTAHDGSGVFTAPLDTVGNDYSMGILIDGVSTSVTLTGGAYADATALGADLQAQINAGLVGVSMTVSYDSGLNQFTFASDSTGSASSVEISSVGTGMANLGIAVAATQSGVDDTFVSPQDTTGYSFDLAVDGGLATTISLGATYSSTEEVRAALQSSIDGAGLGVTVGYDSTSDKFSFTSNTTGISSGIAISNLQGGIANLGIGIDSDLGRDALTGTSGTNVAGTINGVAAFGSGNILLPELGSALSGLSVQIAAGVTNATITIARGFGNEVNNILETFLENNGLIATRETRMNDQLSDLGTDREALDRQMEARYTMLQNQFLAMESIIRSLNSTSGQLEGLVDRLPFTAKK